MIENELLMERIIWKKFQWIFLNGWWPNNHPVQVKARIRRVESFMYKGWKIRVFTSRDRWRLGDCFFHVFTMVGLSLKRNETDRDKQSVTFWPWPKYFNGDELIRRRGANFRKRATFQVVCVLFSSIAVWYNFLIYLYHKLMFDIELYYYKTYTEE